MNRNHLFLLDLQRFAEGGEGAAAGATGETAAAAVPQTTQRAKAKNPLADVQYGKQPQETPAPTAQQTPAEPAKPDRNAAFEALIKGEYKDLYDAKVQDTVKRRLKSTQETVDRYTQLAPVLELLGRKYGISPDEKGNFDPTALQKAVDEDDSYFEEEALRTGIPVERLREMHKTSRENAEMRRLLQEQQSRNQATQLYARWTEQAGQLREVYPDFDLRGELQNPKFGELLNAGIDVRTAYEVLHKDEIIPAAMQFTAQQVEKKLANKIAANGVRPAENGAGGHAAAVVKPDVTQLTREDRREIARRVARGEKISF